MALHELQENRLASAASLQASANRVTALDQPSVAFGVGDPGDVGFDESQILRVTAADSRLGSRVSGGLVGGNADGRGHRQHGDAPETTN